MTRFFVKTDCKQTLQQLTELYNSTPGYVVRHSSPTQVKSGIRMYPRSSISTQLGKCDTGMMLKIHFTCCIFRVLRVRCVTLSSVHVVSGVLP